MLRSASHRLALTITVQGAVALAMLGLVALFLVGAVGHDDTLMSPTMFLVSEIVLAAMIVPLSRLRTRLTGAAIGERIDRAPAVANTIDTYGVLSFVPRPRGRSASLIAPAGAVWAGRRIIAASAIDPDQASLPDWGLLLFRSVEALRTARPEGAVIVARAGAHPRVTKDQVFDDAIVADSVTVEAIWVRPGIAIRSNLLQWAEETGVVVVDDLDELVDGFDGLAIGDPLVTRMPRRRYFVTTYWQAASSSTHRWARAWAAAAVGAMYGCGVLAAALTAAWVATGQNLGWLLAAAAVGGCTVAVLRPIARRVDDRYGRALLQ